MLIIFIDELFPVYGPHFSETVLKSPSLMRGSTTIFPATISLHLNKFLNGLPEDVLRNVLSLMLQAKRFLASGLSVCIVTDKTDDTRHLQKFLELLGITAEPNLTFVAQFRATNEALLRRAILSINPDKSANVLVLDLLGNKEASATSLGLKSVKTPEDLKKSLNSQINIADMRAFIAREGVTVSDLSGNLALQVKFQQGILSQHRHELEAAMRVNIDPNHPCVKVLRLLQELYETMLRESVQVVSVSVGKAEARIQAQQEALYQESELPVSVTRKPKTLLQTNTDRTLSARFPSVPVTTPIHTAAVEKTTAARVAVMLTSSSASSVALLAPAVRLEVENFSVGVVSRETPASNAASETTDEPQRDTESVRLNNDSEETSEDLTDDDEPIPGFK